MLINQSHYKASKSTDIKSKKQNKSDSAVGKIITY